MGREVRMVPADWQHPRDAAGRFIPLYRGGFAQRDAEWSEGYAKWQEGFVRAYGSEGPWRRRDETDGARFTDWEGERPSPDDFMPDWPAEQRTHFMMYEDTSEGTPISPAFATAEELAHWLADTGASAFGDSTASYEAWLRVANGGFAPSLVIENGAMQSGVAALTPSPSMRQESEG